VPKSSARSRADRSPYRLEHRVLQSAAVTFLLRSSDFTSSLDTVCDRIKSSIRANSTEKTIEGRFERELHTFLLPFGIDYEPEKETGIETTRHITQGRLDSRIGSIAIEFKKPSAIVSLAQFRVAERQLSIYLEAIARQTNKPTFGFLTDGKELSYYRFENGQLNESVTRQPLNGKSLIRLIRCLTLSDVEAITPQTLIAELCGESYMGPIYSLGKCLFHILRTRPDKKTEMLRAEWESLFRLGHDDVSQQQRIIQRQSALSLIVDEELSEARLEYGALLAMHTAFAFAIKLMAYKVLTEVYWHDNQEVLTHFTALADFSDKDLQRFCFELEQGQVFRKLGLLNLLEGDFFSWYASPKQWDHSLAESVRLMITTLSRYLNAPGIITVVSAIDLFKDLYESVFPQVIRSSFGEIYTPQWLARRVIQSSTPGPKSKTLDPCCGSGTFLIERIAEMRRELEQTPEPSILPLLLDQVVGVDLNPLAVLMARVNYFLHIADLLHDSTSAVVIPVFLSDSALTPENVVIDGIKCAHFDLTTTKSPIPVTLPLQSPDRLPTFILAMNDFEDLIRSRDLAGGIRLLQTTVPGAGESATLTHHFERLTKQLIDLEKNEWNGIWARIISNYVAVASLGSFDCVVGNPPWVDWKNLPSGYRGKIKESCIERGLFSGDRLAGGINLNISALICYVCAKRFLAAQGSLSFLMPRELAYQQSYQGWRRQVTTGDLRVKEFHDWSKAGHPFGSVKEDFMTYVLQRSTSRQGRVPVFEHLVVREKGTRGALVGCTAQPPVLRVKENVAGQITQGSTAWTIAPNLETLKSLKRLAGTNSYTGREGCEFYPQELLIFEYVQDDRGMALLRNFQAKRSKYKISRTPTPLEKVFLRPMIKSVDIQPFKLNWGGLIVPFPYKSENPKRPLALEEIRKTSPRLEKYYRDNANLMKAQTKYSDRLRGNGDDWWGVARTGPYSFASHYVCFRDNSKWAACVVSSIQLPWGEQRQCVFQNHAVSICERPDGSYISEDEAHYICAILNTPIVESYVLLTSDNRFSRFEFRSEFPLSVLAIPGIRSLASFHGMLIRGLRQLRLCALQHRTCI